MTLHYKFQTREDVHGPIYGMNSEISGPRPLGMSAEVLLIVRSLSMDNIGVVRKGHVFSCIVFMDLGGWDALTDDRVTYFQVTDSESQVVKLLFLSKALPALS